MKYIDINKFQACFTIYICIFWVIAPPFHSPVVIHQIFKSAKKFHLLCTLAAAADVSCTQNQCQRKIEKLWKPTSDVTNEKKTKNCCLFTFLEENRRTHTLDMTFMKTNTKGTAGCLPLKGSIWENLVLPQDICSFVVVVVDLFLLSFYDILERWIRFGPRLVCIPFIFLSCEWFCWLLRCWVPNECAGVIFQWKEEKKREKWAAKSVKHSNYFLV